MELSTTLSLGRMTRKQFADGLISLGLFTYIAYLVAKIVKMLTVIDYKGKVERR